jgi:hypothetical protein
MKAVVYEKYGSDVLDYGEIDFMCAQKHLLFSFKSCSRKNQNKDTMPGTGTFKRTW